MLDYIYIYYMYVYYYACVSIILAAPSNVNPYPANVENMVSS
jgi:hypothetical protein